MPADSDAEGVWFVMFPCARTKCVYTSGIWIALRSSIDSGHLRGSRHNERNAPRLRAT